MFTRRDARLGYVRTDCLAPMQLSEHSLFRMNAIIVEESTEIMRNVGIMLFCTNNLY